MVAHTMICVAGTDVEISRADSNDVDKIELYGKVSLLTVVVWCNYPIVWVLGTGVGAFGISAESISYAVSHLPLSE